MNRDSKDFEILAGTSSRFIDALGFVVAVPLGKLSRQVRVVNSSNGHNKH